MQLISNPKFAIPAAWFVLSCAASRAHSELAGKALAQFGDHGAAVSGCVRDHKPRHVKEELRVLARLVSEYADRAYRARPPMVRVSAIWKLSREVATRDGSGFYGAQTNRKG